MSLQFRIVDADDLSTVLFDFNDPTGGNNAAYASSVKTDAGLGGAINLSSPEREFVQFQPASSPGGVTVATRDALTTMSWRQRIWATSYANLAAGLGWLQRMLANGCVVLWSPDGGATVRYIDVEPSPSPALFGGRGVELHQVATQFDTPFGVELSVLRQPYLRGAELDPTVNILTNPSLLIDTTSDRQPDSWPWLSTTNITNPASVSVTEEAFVFEIATTQARSLQQATGAGTCAENDVWTFSFYAKLLSGAAKMKAAVQYQDSASADVGSESTGTLTALSTSWQRMTVTTSAAPASTDHALVSIRTNNDAAAAVSIYIRLAQFERASSASPWRDSDRGFVFNTLAAGQTLTQAVYIHGDAPTPVKISVYNASTPTMAIVGSRSNAGFPGKRGLTDFLNTRHYLEVEAGTVGTNTTLVADANGSGSGNNVAETTFGSSNTLTPSRVDWSLSTMLDALRGTLAVWARVRLTVGTDTTTLQLVWGFSSTDTRSGSTIPFAPGDTNWRYVFLGYIGFPDLTTFSSAYFDLRARRDTGTGNVRCDYISFGPTDGGLGIIGVDATAKALAGLMSDPANSRVVGYAATGSGRAAITQAPKVLGTCMGPVPCVMQPGLNIIWVAFSLDDVVGGASYQNNTAVSASIALGYTPRYYA